MPTLVELSGASPPPGFETDGESLVGYLKGGEAPRRDYFYWELHEGKPIRAARFGDWKAVRNGIDRPIELYDLRTDRGERDDLADSHPDQVARAEQIFAAAHRPDPNWPMDGRSEARQASQQAAWRTTRKRVEEAWAPEAAQPQESIAN